MAAGRPRARHRAVVNAGIINCIHHWCFDGSGGHPRKYDVPRTRREYGLMRGLLTLPAITNSSTLRTAQALHIADRGVIAVGKFADVIVFDPRTIAERDIRPSP